MTHLSTEGKGIEVGWTRLTVSCTDESVGTKLWVERIIKDREMGIFFFKMRVIS
jgi:hypothetical protein